MRHEKHRCCCCWCPGPQLAGCVAAVAVHLPGHHLLPDQTSCSAMAHNLEHPTPPRLPSLFLQNVVVLPALQLSFPIFDDVAHPIVKLMLNSECPIIGVFPLSSAGQPPSEWGCGMLSLLPLWGDVSVLRFLI